MEEELIIRAADLDDISLIGYIAQQSWPVAYRDILSEEQLSYMLNLFYSPASLRKQMTSYRQQFLIAEFEEEAVGFASYSEIEKQVFKLHKLYVLPPAQKKGIGKALLDSVVSATQDAGAKTLRLNVNRNNKARDFYERCGFKVVKQEDIEIGQGYLMEDFVMEMDI